MGLFSFGGSTQRAKSSGESQSTSSSFGRASSVQGSESGSFSTGTSRSRSEQGSAAVSGQEIAFEDVFARLFGSAESAAGGLDPSLLTEAANQLFSGGTGFLERLGGDRGTEFLAERLSADNPVLQEQIDLLGEDLGRFFAEDLNPAITADAVGAGQLGGGRQGVAQGRALELVGEEFRRGAADLRGADVARRDAIAAGIAERDVAGIGTGLASLPQLAALAQTGLTADLLPASMLSQILGDPTVLTASQSESFGSSFADAIDFARAFSESFGVATSESGSESQSTSRTKSSSKAKSANFGFV